MSSSVKTHILIQTVRDVDQSWRLLFSPDVVGVDYVTDRHHLLNHKEPVALPEHQRTRGHIHEDIGHILTFVVFGLEICTDQETGRGTDLEPLVHGDESAEVAETVPEPEPNQCVDERVKLTEQFVDFILGSLANSQNKTEHHHRQSAGFECGEDPILLEQKHRHHRKETKQVHTPRRGPPLLGSNHVDLLDPLVSGAKDLVEEVEESSPDLEKHFQVTPLLLLRTGLL